MRADKNLALGEHLFRRGTSSRNGKKVHCCQLGINGHLAALHEYISFGTFIAGAQVILDFKFEIINHLFPTKNVF